MSELAREAALTAHRNALRPDPALSHKLEQIRERRKQSDEQAIQRERRQIEKELDSIGRDAVELQVKYDHLIRTKRKLNAIKLELAAM